MNRITPLVLLVLALSGVSVACGDDNPVAPTPPPRPANIAGNWTGTFTYTPPGGGQRTIVAVTAAFTQADANFTGQINITGGSRMTMSGTTTASTLTSSVQYASPSPSTCAGSASVSGTVSSAQIRFTVPTLATSGGCTFFTDGEFLLNK